MLINPRTLFRTVAIAEAISWAGLLVGMLFKWVLRTTEVGVAIFGPIHGGVFVAYLVSVLLVRRPLGWRMSTVLLAVAASVPPFATLVFEMWADRHGLLREGASRRPTADGAVRESASA